MVNTGRIDKFWSARSLDRVTGTALRGRCGSSGRGRSGIGQYCRVLAIFAVLVCAFMSLRSDPAGAQCRVHDGSTKVNANWKSVILHLAEGAEAATTVEPVTYSQAVPDVEAIRLSARVAFSRLPLAGAIEAIRNGTSANANFVASFDSNSVFPFPQGKRPFFRYQAEFKNAQGGVMHRAVQCSIENGEVEGYDFATYSQDLGPVFMCDWTGIGIDDRPAGGKAPLSPYFEQRPRMSSDDAVQTAIVPLTANDETIFYLAGYLRPVTKNRGFPLIEMVDILLNMLPRGGEGGALPAGVVFSLTDWSGEISVGSAGCYREAFLHFRRDPLILPLDQRYFDRTSTSLLTFMDESPSLTTLTLSADEPVRDHPEVLGDQVEFMVTLSPEFSEGAGAATAVVDLQLDQANAVFLPGGGLVLSEGDSSRASISLSTTSVGIRVSVTPDTRLDSSVTLSASEDGNSLGTLILTVLAPASGPARLRMELRDEQGQSVNRVTLDAEGSAEGQLFIQVLDAGNNGLAVDLAGLLRLELDGLTGQLMQVRVQPGNSPQLPSLATDGTTVDVVFMVLPSLFTTATLVVESYADLSGARLPLRFERAAETRLVSGKRLSIGAEFLCGLSELGTVRCGGQAGPNGGAQRSRSVSQGDYNYEVFEVLDGDAEPVTTLSGVVALGQSVSSPPVSCALLRDGGVSCWGESRTFGGIEIDYMARRLPNLRNVLQLSMGMGFACALVARDGDEGGTEIHCWGDNSSGQAGQDLGLMPIVEAPQLATELSALKGVIQLAAGESHACALQADGRVFCWGLNGQLQLLGDGDTGLTSQEPLEVAVANAVQIAAGERFSCALSRSGAGEKDSVWCWGGEYSADALADKLADRVSPIAGLASAPGARLRQLTVAGPQGCALVDTGEPWCWREDATSAADSWVYGNDFDVGDDRQALCFSESGAQVPCLGEDAAVPQHTIARQLARAEDSLYYRSVFRCLAFDCCHNGRL